MPPSSGGERRESWARLFMAEDKRIKRVKRPSRVKREEKIHSFLEPSIQQGAIGFPRSPVPYRCVSSIPYSVDSTCPYRKLGLTSIFRCCM